MHLQTQLLTAISASCLPLETAIQNAMMALLLHVNNNNNNINNSSDMPATATATKTTRPKCLTDFAARIREKVAEDLRCCRSDEGRVKLRQAGWYRFVNKSVLALREGEEEEEDKEDKEDKEVKEMGMEGDCC
jgi:hypothetical protein